MKTKFIFLLLIMAVILAGCGTKEMEGSMTLLDQNKQEITFPQEKPTLFFFITTYT